MDDQRLRKKIESLLPALNEKQKRLFLAAEAESLGYGGISKVSRLSGMSRPIITEGIKELQSEDNLYDNHIRAKGGGPKPIHRSNKKLIKLIDEVVSDSTRGDPASPLRWTTKSTREISSELEKRGYKVSYRSVYTILRDLEYSLQANEKSIAKKSSPDRDEQFKYINKRVKRFLKKSLPVISIDAKKRENLGNHLNKGSEWRSKGNPRKVEDHDFPDEENGIAIPYGVYDINQNLGWVNVGTDHETSAFAVHSIFQWWEHMGEKMYSQANELLVCADSGGSNGYNRRMWKYKLQELANQLEIKITVCHFPPGTSKWNKVEHRLFSYISMNWKGKPLINHNVVVNLISNTKTRTGLKVKAKLDKEKYPLGLRVTDSDYEKINIKPHKFHGDWNYTIRPQNDLGLTRKL